MHIFKKLPLLFISTFIFTGCMKYQYTTLSSNLNANENQEFFIENDSLMIKYSFSGYDGPVKISVYNKLNTPMYVDWKRSALVLNDQSNTYWQNSSTLVANAQSYQIAWTPMVSSSSSTISGEIKGEESISFIAPTSYRQTNMVMINPDFIKWEGPKKQHRVNIHTPTGPVGALSYKYQKENTPLKFRSYLTLATDPSFAKPLTYESEFWVVEVLQTGASPELLLNKKADQNKFYKSKLTGFGTVVGVTSLVLILGVIGANQ